jgi:hypothetical protein
MRKWLGFVALVVGAGASFLLIDYLWGGHTIHSEILGEERSVFIHRPPGYSESNDTYPVLYLLDAHARNSSSGPDFQTVAKQVDTMSHEGIPPMIVVGVVNTHRSRDMLPIKTRVYSESGGADKFLAFLTEELVPYVDKNYRTSGERILYGRSDSGLFTLYALLEKPDAFSGYISSSPMVGHCPDLMRIKTGRLFEQHPALEATLFLIYGDDDLPYARRYIPVFAQAFRKRSGDGIRFGMNIVPGGGHVPQSSLPDGLRFYFSS